VRVAVRGRDLPAVLAEVEVRYIVLKICFKVWAERANTMMPLVAHADTAAAALLE